VYSNRPCKRELLLAGGRQAKHTPFGNAEYAYTTKKTPILDIAFTVEGGRVGHGVAFIVNNDGEWEFYDTAMDKLLPGR